jgi:mycoredoxin-dependent peroxiredoxin
MSQAEIAGGKPTAADEVPSKGHRLRDFELMSSEGEPVRLSDYRGRSNLILILTDERREVEGLLATIGSHYEEIQNEGAEVLAIMPASREQTKTTRERLNLPFRVLSDDNRHIHRQLGAVDSEDRDAAAVYITDRFGEVFAAYRTSDRQTLPPVADILKWLEFINAQCPECEAPEWPI